MLTLFIVLIVLACGACIYAGYCLMNGKDLPFGLMSGGRKASATPVAIRTSQESIITVRSANGRIEIHMEVDPDQISDNRPAEFDSGVEGEEMAGGNDVQRLLAEDTPMEERRMIYEELMATGVYQLRPFGELFPDSMEARLPQEGSVSSPSDGKEDAEAAKAPADGTQEASGETEESEEKVQEADERAADAAEKERQESGEGAAPVMEWDYDEADYKDNHEAVLMAVRLMEYVADSLRRGLIDPGLAYFTQMRLKLRAVDDVWNEELRNAARESMMKFERSEPDMDELHRMVKEDVERNSAGRAAGEEEPKKARPMATRGSTARIDTRGGFSDASWDRLMGD